MKKVLFFLNLSAIATFFLFFSTETHADCTKDVDCKGDRICEKGVCIDPGQTESSSTPINAKKQNSFEDLLKKIDGRRYTMVIPINNPNGRPGFIGATQTMTIDVRGNVFVTGWIYSGTIQDGYSEGEKFEIQGRETWHQLSPSPGRKVQFTHDVYTISDDGDRITKRIHWSDGDTREIVYFWQR